jgi:TPR repeat protein
MTNNTNNTAKRIRLLPLAQRIALLCLVAIPILSLGEQSAAPEDSWIHVVVRGAGEWFRLAALKEESDAYLRNQEPELDLREYEVTAHIYGEATNLVSFVYFKKHGAPAFDVRFDNRGEIRRLVRTIPKCGFQESVGLFSLLAETGDVSAQAYLARFCEDGVGGERDLIEAYKWYSLAAQGGDSFSESQAKGLRRRLNSAQVAEAEERVAAFLEKRESR